MALRKLERRNHGGKWPMSIKYQYLHSFKEGLILLCRSILETRRITHLHGSAHFTIPLTTLSSSKIFERVLKTSLIPIQSWQQQNNTHGRCCYLHCWLWSGKCPLDSAEKNLSYFLPSTIISKRGARTPVNISDGVLCSNSKQISPSSMFAGILSTPLIFYIFIIFQIFHKT